FARNGWQRKIYLRIFHCTGRNFDWKGYYGWRIRTYASTRIFHSYYIYVYAWWLGPSFGKYVIPMGVWRQYREPYWSHPLSYFLPCLWNHCLIKSCFCFWLRFVDT